VHGMHASMIVDDDDDDDHDDDYDSHLTLCLSPQ
jgi:hypothetical protein